LRPLPIEALYGRPRFTEEERVQYFSLSSTEKTVLEQFHPLKSRLYWVLQLGYFKAKQQFFTFEFPEVAEDARYIQEQFFPELQFAELERAPLHITKVTRLKQRRSILELCRYRLCGAQERRQLQAKARQAARVSAKPIFIFRELLQYLTEQHIVRGPWYHERGARETRGGPGGSEPDPEIERTCPPERNDVSSPEEPDRGQGPKGYEPEQS
jgi:hypothetical protein